RRRPEPRPSHRRRRYARCSVVAARRKARIVLSGPRQRGQAALLTVLLVLGIAATAVAYTRIGPTDIEIERDKRSAAALAQARDALIGRAAADSTRPGSLPCPDIDNDGDAESPVTYGGVCPSYIGRFPWKTL